jgi:hypothetical protein
MSASAAIWPAGAAYVDGRYIDVVIMGILKTEFR